MLNIDQITLIQDSFASVVPLSDSTAAAFDDRRFAVAPTLRPLFATLRDTVGPAGMPATEAGEATANDWLTGAMVDAVRQATWGRKA